MGATRKPDEQGLIKYIHNRERSPQSTAKLLIGNRGGISHLASRYNLNVETVRSHLSKRGWTKQPSPNGLIFWYPPHTAPDPRRSNLREATE